MGLSVPPTHKLPWELRVGLRPIRGRSHPGHFPAVLPSPRVEQSPVFQRPLEFSTFRFRLLTVWGTRHLNLRCLAFKSLGSSPSQLPLCPPAPWVPPIRKPPWPPPVALLHIRGRSYPGPARFQ